MTKIILGISGSIAAYKACDLVRLLTKDGFGVFATMTKSAQKFITPLTIKTLTENDVATDLFKDKNMEHIRLKKEAKLMVIAPATANIIGKFASGIADDVLSTTFLSVECPVIIAPSMNPNIWNKPIVQSNVSKLKKAGVIFVKPQYSQTICNDIGEGKMADIQEIFETVKSVLK